MGKYKAVENVQTDFHYSYSVIYSLFSDHYIHNNNNNNNHLKIFYLFMNTKSFKKSHATLLIHLLTVRLSKNTETPNECRETRFLGVYKQSDENNSVDPQYQNDTLEDFSF